MKDTIEEELNRNIISKEIINNCLLEEIQEDDKIIVVTKYIKNNSIKETFLTNKDEKTKISVSPNNNYIAILKKDSLVRIYNTIENKLEYYEFSDIVYNNNFEDKVDIYKNLAKRKDGKQ